MEYERYFSFLSELQQVLDRLTNLQQQKLEAIGSNDMDRLDEYMKQEQATAMDLRGRERKRTQLLQQLGISGVSVKDLPHHCPPQYQQQANEICQKVLRSYQVLSSSQQACRTVMESRLRDIDQEMTKRRSRPERSSSTAKQSQSDFRV